MINLEKFISENVTKRPSSMFLPDIRANIEELENRINNKSVLVIGGAGSIGSSFIRAILPFKPSTLVVADINENALAELARDLRATVWRRYDTNAILPGGAVPKDDSPYPIDFASPIFEKMFREREGFDIVANFSAHKHVRSEKDVHSIEALIRNNVINAKKLLDILSEYPPEVYFCVSTDKAANPVNIMGASKRIMEDVIFSYSDRFSVKTARFANVAFSNGSLPDGFLKRIAKYQPLAGPSDVKRYFVSPEESGQICMLAAILGKNREIFFPKLKEAQMMTFDEIGRKLLAEYGFKTIECSSDEEAVEKADLLKRGEVSDDGYPVYFTKSDTSGEKQYEEFYTAEEKIDLNRLQALGVITEKKIPEREETEKLFEEFAEVFDRPDVSKEDIVRIISGYLPNFEHIETGKTLDSKM